MRDSTTSTRARRVGVVTALVALSAALVGFWAPAALADHDHGKGSGHQGDHPGGGPPADSGGGGGGGGGGAGSSGGGGGHDASVEPGNSGTQGKSESNPDGGGIDKPWCGTEGQLPCQGDEDRDGNNGCGNDTDREDDNNGWCGRKPANAQAAGRPGPVTEVALPLPANPTEAIVAGAVLSTGNPGIVAQVMGAVFERSNVIAPAPAVAPEVLGVQFDRGQLDRGQPLAFTGANLYLLALAGLGLVGTGFLALRLTRARLRTIGVR